MLNFLGVNIPLPPDATDRDVSGPDTEPHGQIEVTVRRYELWVRHHTFVVRHPDEALEKAREFFPEPGSDPPEFEDFDGDPEILAIQYGPDLDDDGSET